MGTNEDQEQKVWHGRNIPLGMFSDPNVGLPTRVLLVYAAFPGESGWAGLGTRTVATLVGVVPLEGLGSLPKREADNLLSKVRTARKSLIDQGLLETRVSMSDQDVKTNQYRVVFAPPPVRTMKEWNRMGEKLGVRYEPEVYGVDVDTFLKE